MSISTYLSELDSINKEMIRLKGLIKNLNDKKTNLEKNIQKWLVDNNQNSISYNGKIISLNNTTSSKRKKKTEKMEDLSQVLKKYGIYNNNKMINELMEVNKGNRIEITKLNFKNKK